MTYLELLERADHHGDLIYRQDALDALGEEPEVWLDEDYEIAQRDQWRMDRSAIESVSAYCGYER